MQIGETEENSEDCCCIIGAYNNDFFIQTDSTDCLHKISCTLCLLFTYCLFQSALKHGSLGLSSLFTFKQVFGQLQQIRKRN